MFDCTNQLNTPINCKANPKRQTAESQIRLDSPAFNIFHRSPKSPVPARWRNSASITLPILRVLKSLETSVLHQLPVVWACAMINRTPGPGGPAVVRRLCTLESDHANAWAFADAVDDVVPGAHLGLETVVSLGELCIAA